MIPGQFNLDIFSEIQRICHFPYKLCIMEKTFEELQKILETQKGGDKRAAKLALCLIQAKELMVIPMTQSTVDDAIVSLVKEHKDQYIIATNDRELKRRLQEAHAKRMVMRQQKYLIME
ncbi:hypothetical protein HYW21_06965 [Candidatus Woesearchaeota archaeon]|nr:hypothetical protein [Candidatus Woesearchaeota archaeon]